MPHRTSHLVAAAIQLNCQESVEANLARIRPLVAEAKGMGASLIVLPENFAFMGPEEEKLTVAEMLPDGPIASALRALAREQKVAIVGGGMPEKSSDPKRPFNTSILVDEAGEVIARYRKIHLFDAAVPGQDALVESRGSSPGDEAVVASWSGLRVGLTICYDVRFPELYRKLADQGADLVTIPAAFTMLTGKDHWHVLMRARAIENQCFVIAAAQTGRHAKGRMTYGKSVIVDPWGDVLAQAGEGEGIAIARLSLQRLRDVREQLPALRHRRL